MIIPAVRIDKIRRLSENAVEVLKVLAAALGDGIGRVEYGLIAKETGIPRSSVASAVDALIRDGTVELVNGELYVGNALIWFEIEE